MNLRNLVYMLVEIVIWIYCRSCCLSLTLFSYPTFDMSVIAKENSTESFAKKIL